MSRLRVADALSGRVVSADAEARLGDIRDEIERCEATHVAVFEQGRFRGLIRLRDILLIAPQRIFADLLPRPAPPVLALDTPISEIGWMLAEAPDALPVLDAAGEFVGVVTRQSLLSALLTEHRRTDEQMRRLHAELSDAQRLKVVREMAAGIAHELHQPLAVIANYAHGSLRRLQRGTLEPERLADIFREIAAETTRAGGIIRHIREFLAARRGERQPVDLNAVIRDAVQFASYLVRRNEAQLELGLTESLPEVPADRIELTQIVLNLILNGLHAMRDLDPADRRLTIETRPSESGGVEVRVTDRGHGIPPELQPRIFEQFFTTRPDGLGLGLAVSRSVVEEHGGRMWVTSQVGRGSTFGFTLPPATT